MLRKFLVLSLLLLAGSALRAADPTNPALVYSLARPEAITTLEENPAVTGQMVDELVCALTAKPNRATAWASLVSPKDRIGIKVAASGGRYFGSHRGVVEAIVSGLLAAGVPSSQIVIWDRDADRLLQAGFKTQRGRYMVRNIPPGSGYDRQAEFSAPILGRLIWGDLLFRGPRPKNFGRLSSAPDPKEDQLSGSSYLANLLSREVTKIINVPVLTDEAGCGIAGALYNLTVPNVDNWRRLVQSDGSGNESIAALYADEHIGPKVILHLLDALLPQYAGGPEPNPNYAFAHKTLYLSRDPVAVDSIGLRLLEEWRQLAKLPPVGPRARWLLTAEEMGLGQFDPTKIKQIALRP